MYHMYLLNCQIIIITIMAVKTPWSLMSLSQKHEDMSLSHTTQHTEAKQDGHTLVIPELGHRDWSMMELAGQQDKLNLQAPGPRERLLAKSR